MKASYEIAFRTDASIEMGSGHVMRCLTMADFLADNGGTCHFICRDLPGHMMEHISSRGHAVTRLPAPTAKQAERTLAAVSLPPHATWAGVPMEDEIAESCAAIARLAPDRVIVDHYALDAVWETQATPRGTPIMVIDDLADRPHVCDILLDQNLGRRTEDYRGLVPTHCKQLIGPHYALLRPEFGRLREKALLRRKQSELQNLLITLGGTDKDNVTGGVMEAISKLDLPANLKITIVMGQHAPWLDIVRAQAGTMPRPTRVLCGVSNMADLMVEADLCIGAAGSTSWERCALGLPTLLLVLADNQRPSAAALAENHAAVLLRDLHIEKNLTLLKKFLSCDGDPNRLRTMSFAAADLVDGAGTSRVINQIELHRDRMRAVNREDIGLIWDWRYGDGAEQFYRATGVPSLDAHTAWMERAMLDPLRDLRVFCHAGQPLAHIRYDIVADNPIIAEIGICLSKETRGQGLGQRALRMACDAPPRGVQLLKAEIHKKNAGSARIFEKVGFRHVGIDGEFLQFILDVTGSMHPAAPRILPEEKNSNDN